MRGSNLVTHGDSHSSEYRAWGEMYSRCQSKTRKDYKDYGGRGITIDPAWKDYKQFLADMGRKPTPKHTLERIDNNLGYTKHNCRWATRRTQARNRRVVCLTKADADAIRQEYAYGSLKQYQLADKYGVSPSHVSKIISHRNWI